MRKKHYPSNKKHMTLCGHETTPNEWTIIKNRINKTYLINCKRCLKKLDLKK